MQTTYSTTKSAMGDATNELVVAVNYNDVYLPVIADST